MNKQYKDFNEATKEARKLSRIFNNRVYVLASAPRGLNKYYSLAINNVK